MTEETASPATPLTTEATAAPSPAEQATETAAKPTESAALEPDWLSRLDDDNERKRALEHPKLKQEIEHRVKSTRETDIEARVQQRLTERLQSWQSQEQRRQMLEMDSYELGEKVKADAQRQKEIEQWRESERPSIRKEEQTRLGEYLGRLLPTLPDWDNNTDWKELANTLAGTTSEEEAFARIPIVVGQILGRKQAAKEKAAFREKELAKEREAIRQEEAAKLLQGSEAPDLAPPKGRPTNVKLADLPQDQFDAAWERMKQGKAP